MRISETELQFFTRSEFDRGGRNWFEHMSPKALVLLDTTRLQWESKIKISPDPGALGRTGSKNEYSQHYHLRPGGVGAIDHIPEGIETAEDVERYVYLLTSLGWTGIGFYPVGASGPRFHGDVRTDQRPLHPATWGQAPDSKGALRTVSIRDAVDYFDRRAY